MEGRLYDGQMQRLPRSLRGGDDHNIAGWEGPFEGIPTWLRVSIFHWIYPLLSEAVYMGRQYSTSKVAQLERELRVSINWQNQATINESIQQIFDDDDSAIDLLDWAVGTLADGATARTLQEILHQGGSAWTVGTDETSRFELQRVVGETVRLSVREAAPPGSRASAHLAAAWSAQYGRNQDASKAYREAIRAVESAAHLVVLPKDPSATLGKMISALRDAPQKWKVVLESSSANTAVEQVAAMMELIWRSQLDRHGTADESVPLAVTAAESAAALHTAAAIVQLFTTGAIIARS